MSEVTPSPTLCPSEVRGLLTAVGFMTAGEADGVEARQITAATTAARKLGRAPALATWVPFSRQELRLLVLAVENGAEGILQSSSGFRVAERLAFRRAANRLLKASGLSRPGY